MIIPKYSRATQTYFPDSSGGTVKVSVSPTSGSLLSTQTEQFTTSVSGTSDTAVTWSATTGSVSSNGLYTGFRGRGKSRIFLCFWVAQRFTAAINGLSSMPASAAGVMLPREKHFSATWSAVPQMPHKDKGFTPRGNR